MAWGIFIGVVGAAFAWMGWRKGLELERYEFQHRTSGGVVQFADFDAAKRHERRQNYAEGNKRFGALLIFVAILIMIFHFVTT